MPKQRFAVGRQSRQTGLIARGDEMKRGGVPRQAVGRSSAGLALGSRCLKRRQDRLSGLSDRSNHRLQPTALGSGRVAWPLPAVAEPDRSILKRKRLQVVVESGLRVGTAVRSWQATKTNRTIGGGDGLVIGGVLTLRLGPGG